MTTYLDKVQSVVNAKSDETFATWYDDKGNQTNQYTFKQLWDEAGYCAYLLRNKWGINKGDRVVLCYAFGLHFFAIFLGCLRAGVTAVIVYPPAPPLAKSLTKMMKVIEDCSPKLILTESLINMMRLADLANLPSKSRSLWPSSIKYQVTDLVHRRATKKPGLISLFCAAKNEQKNAPIKSFDEASISQNDLAFLQYTSGSTGNPKGVMVTHGALGANIVWTHDSWSQGFGRDITLHPFTGFSWLPQYHDMGLVEMILAPFAAGCRMHMMSPVSFIRDPLLWMQLISKHECEMGSAPDFAFQLVTRKFREFESRGRTSRFDTTLDLAKVQRIQNAAEPIRLDTMRIFSEAFSPYGLPDDWFLTAYGLAEHVVGVSWYHGCHLSSPREDDPNEYIAIGHTGTFHHSSNFRIVDPTTMREIDDDATGEIWVAGPSVAAGYYGQKELSDQTFRARIVNSESALAYLRTGDLGFMQDGYLYICGRQKDLIIVNGVNYYPQDIEHAVQDSSGAIRPGCVAAFASDETGNDGQLEIVFEIRSGMARDAKNVCEGVIDAVMDKIGLMPSRIVAVEERTIAKTTSGKIQRRRNCELLHDNKHKVVEDVHLNAATTDRSTEFNASVPMNGMSQRDSGTSSRSRMNATVRFLLGLAHSRESSTRMMIDR